MKVVVLSCVFPPEPVVSGSVGRDVAVGLARRGHDVTIITGYPSHPGGELYPGYRRRLFGRDTLEPSIDVRRCPATLSRTSTLPSRLLENLTFGLTSSLTLLLTPRPDIIFSNSWPVVATGLALGVARLRRIPVVLSVQDVYPESLVSQGRIRPGGFAARLLSAIDRTIARRVARLAVISPHFAEIYRDDRRVPADRIVMVYNWRSTDGIEPLYPSAVFRARKDIPADAFVFAYGGNVGAAAGVETVIRACAHLTDGYRFLIAGRGSNLDACRELAVETAPERIIFHPDWPVEETAPALSAAEVLVLPTVGDQSLASVPSKLIAYLLCGRPVLALARPESDLADLIRVSGCGWVIPPDDPPAVARTLEEIRALPRSELDRRGADGRRFALRELTDEACLPKILELVESAAGEYPVQP